jgi:diguanylate cyclase (GGDEF)-like protein
MGIMSRVLSALTNDHTIAFIFLDRDGNPIWASPSLTDFVALDMNAPNPLFAATHPDDVTLCEEVFRLEQAGAADQTFTMDCRYELIVRLKSPNGTWRRVAMRTLNYVDDPAVDGYLIHLTLGNQELATVAAFDAAARGVQASGVISALLEALETGGTSNALAAVFDDVDCCIAASANAPIRAGDYRNDPRWAAASNGRIDSIVPVVSTRTGSAFGVLETCSAFSDVRPFTLALTHSVAQRVALVLDNDADRKNLQHEAEFDALTGLRNRRSFRRQYRAIDESLAVSLIFVDADQFKLVNDTYGHEAGDAVLVELARRLQSFATPKDLLARMGGDEFVLLRIHDHDHLAPLCPDEIATVLRQPIDLGTALIEVSCSVGIAHGQGADRRDLIGRADAEMYEAKRLRFSHSKTMALSR